MDFGNKRSKPVRVGLKTIEKAKELAEKYDFPSYHAVFAAAVFNYERLRSFHERDRDMANDDFNEFKQTFK